MSKYTTEVRFICEMSAGLTESADYSNVAQIIHTTHNAVIGEYPIFDEAYRETLNTKILKHYYTREICEETVGLWKLRLNTRMNEIMPYYNKLYKSELLNFNPFYDVDLTTTHLRSEDTQGNLISKTKDNRNDSKNTNSNIERTTQSNSIREDETARTGNTETLTENSNASKTQNETHSGINSSSESNDNKNQTDKYSDTPQGGITGLESGTYLTNARIINAKENNKQQSNQQTDALGNTTYNENGNSKDSTNRTDTEHFNTKGKTDNTDSTKTGTSELLNSNANGERTDKNNVNTTEDYLEHVQGKRGGTSFAKLLAEYRETFINIDKMIIDELSDLFFGLWE